VGGYCTIISLEPCALNADFQHFIPRFNKISLLYGYPWKKGLSESSLKDKVTLQIILVYILRPKTIYTLQQDKCKCKQLH
jgi:hypothetical protein